MANAADKAIAQAVRLPEVRFSQFTSQLVTSVFDALLDADLKQMESYSNLVKASASTLQDFINNTKGSVAANDISTFLSGLNLPKLTAGKSITADQARLLNSAVTLPDEAGIAKNNLAIDIGAGAGPVNLDANLIKAINDAVANRIAANRYDLLLELVRLGVLRLVVDNGVIETRLTFKTYGTSTSVGASSQLKTRTSGFGLGGGFDVGAALFGGGGGEVSTTVSAASDLHRDVNGSSVQIFGRVEIHFKTDYTPLKP